MPFNYLGQPWLPGNDPEFARQAALTAAFAADFTRRALVSPLVTNPAVNQIAAISAIISTEDTARRALGTSPMAITQIIECDPSVSINAAGTTIVGTERS